MKLAVIVASTKRAKTLSSWADHVRKQSLQPHRFIYSVVDKSDLPENLVSGTKVGVVFGPVGSSSQRNRGLLLAKDQSDLLAFFDDDYVPASNCFERIVQFFELQKDVIGANGHLLADGINGPGIDYCAALTMIRSYDEQGIFDISIERDLRGLYGCNMVFRTSAIGDVTFDERLPLYGWQEDVDFAARLMHRGRIVKTRAFSGVHLGVKGGRTSGIRFGYSQIANPVYLVKKGTMDMSFAVKIVLKNIISNHTRLFFPEKWVDRKGRARGNWIAVVDILRGKSDPMRVLDL